MIIAASFGAQSIALGNVVAISPAPDHAAAPKPQNKTKEDSAQSKVNCFEQTDPMFYSQMLGIIENFNTSRDSNLSKSQSINAAAGLIATLPSSEQQEAATEIMANINTNRSNIVNSLTPEQKLQQLKALIQKQHGQCNLLDPKKAFDPDAIANAITQAPETLTGYSYPESNHTKTTPTSPKSPVLALNPNTTAIDEKREKASSTPISTDLPDQAVPPPPAQPQNKATDKKNIASKEVSHSLTTNDTPPPAPAPSTETSTAAGTTAKTYRNTYVPKTPTEMLNQIEQDKNPLPLKVPPKPKTSFFATVGAKISTFFSGIFNFLFGWLKK